MKEFDITITETLEKAVTVSAETKDQAEEAVKQGYYDSEYVLDAENFTGVDFAVQAEREVQLEQSEKLNVLLVKPGQYPQQVEIGGELEDLQKAVGGDIEAVYPYKDAVALIVNDEGKLNGAELNRGLRTEDGELYDIVAGDFLVVGLGEEDFASLAPGLMEKYEAVFHQPEMFVRMGRSVMAIPMPDDRVQKPNKPEKAADAVQKSTPDRGER